MSEITRLFGNRAGAYASFRPQYPDGLFTWLAANSPGQERALDIACGNGQASRPLMKYFHQVLACDGSPEQLRAAPDLQGIDCFAADASAQPLADASLDLIVVAQALHWFATPAFFAETRRLLRSDGLFCAWCYSLLRIDAALDAVLDDLYWNTLGGYWPSGRASVDAGYRDIQPPFARIEVPAFAIELEWDLQQLMGYLGTWSAVQKLEQASGRDPLPELLPKLRRAWGDGQQKRFVRWPLHFLAGLPTRPHS
ncbi:MULTISPECIES: class I SAM-dependent methyltransferase [unclassified Pseudomonas]|uniref:class I SAM-dependent methyltransferase n=1 Tax=unclassified Pseudomonas TaxID=196821 RepID=UPI00244CDEB7|nr:MULTISPECIES: class I SAM-dependent methyltransferase [unclassified Pseudomonas]MDG9923723.1 class I SAM-dependent methyltransferase [Pseudomonas sp. GD04045]MDH0036002.1 class I SAM-dependent methyltransferase [Pseudomonas sp. GD04019]